MAATNRTLDELAGLGGAIFDQTVRPALRPDVDGTFVAVDVETGEYEIDADDYAAVARLRSRQPEADVWLMRAGYPTTYKDGGCPMIQGVVNARHEAIVRVRLRGPGGIESDVDAIVDSGFTSSLTLTTADGILDRVSRVAKRRQSSRRDRESRSDGRCLQMVNAASRLLLSPLRGSDRGACFQHLGLASQVTGCRRFATLDVRQPPSAERDGYFSTGITTFCPP